MPTSPRWTHVALPVNDIGASVAWYERYTPLRALEVRRDADGDAAWLGHPEPTDTPFILVLVSLDATRGERQRQLGPFGHLGIELPSKDQVDAVAERARSEGCLEWEPAWHPPPVGYVCSALDPDGNVVEFSFDQGVERRVREVWGTPDEPVRPDG